MNYLLLFISVICGYLIGSIPSALIIGKTFFHKDIRDYGSHNLGGTNAGRVLGHKAGIIVILLDILKIIIAMLIVYFIAPMFKVINLNPYILVTALLAVIGHCYPLYCGFKGGKAVSVIVGFLLITNYLLFAIWVIIFFFILYLKRMVSLSSMLTSLIVALLSFIPFFSNTMLFLVIYDIYYCIVLLLLSIILIIRHIPNIKRLLNHTESKIKWMDRKKSE